MIIFGWPEGNEAGDEAGEGEESDDSGVEQAIGVDPLPGGMGLRYQLTF